MAFNATKTPLLKSILTRGFAAQAHQKVAATKINELQVTTLSNQTVVASIDQSAPNANVSVVFRAGSRDESYDTQGLTRVLGIGASLSNKKSSGFRIRTNIESTGGSLVAEANRETFAYTLSVKRNQLDTGLKFLKDVSTQQDFRYWELNDIADRVNDDLIDVTGPQRAIDALHQAIYARGLGNLQYIGNLNIKNIDADALQSFVSKNFTSNRAAVVGVGIDHDSLLRYAETLQLSPGTASVSPSKYLVGQYKIDQTGGSASVAIGTSGASSANPKEALAFAVLRQIAGSGRIIQNSGPVSALSKVVDSSLSKPYEFDSFNAVYSDSGLFGFVLTADAQEVGKAIEAAVKALKSGSVSQGDVDAAKAQLKTAVLEQFSSSAGRFQDLISQVSSGQVQGKSEIVAAIDGVSVADVNAAAKKVASGKWSIGAIGNLANVPHVNDLN